MMDPSYFLFFLKKNGDEVNLKDVKDEEFECWMMIWSEVGAEENYSFSQLTDSLKKKAIRFHF